jgi:hypothetical protein
VRERGGDGVDRSDGLVVQGGEALPGAGLFWFWVLFVFFGVGA